MAGAPAQAQSLLGFLIQRGGIKEESGELKSMGALRQRPGLINNKTGLSHDYAREAAVEAGFLHPDASVTDLRTAIGEELAGRRQVRQGEAGADMFEGEQAKGGRLNDQYREQSKARILMAEEDAGQRLSPEEIEHASELHMRGDIHPDEALRQASEAYVDKLLQRQANQNAFSGEAGLPSGATQQAMGLKGGLKSETKGAAGPLVSAEDAAKLRAADAGWRQFKQDSAGKIGDVLRTGPQAVVDSEVGRRLFGASRARPEDVAQFIKTAGSQAKGMEAARQYLAHEMRQAGVVRDDGTIDLRKHAAWYARRRDTIGQLGGDLDQRIGTAAAAQKTLEAVTAEHEGRIAAFQKSAAAKFIEADPKVAFGKAVGEGRANGDKAALKLMDAVKGDPAALEGLKAAGVEYIVDRFRAASPSGAGEDFIKAKNFRDFIRANAPFLRRLYGGQGMQRFESVAAELRNLAQKTQTLAGSATEANRSARLRLGGHATGHTSGWTMLVGEHLGEHLGEVLGHGMIGSALGVAAAPLIGMLRQKGIKTVQDLVQQAMLHPELALELRQRFGARAPGPVYWRRVAMRLGQTLASVPHGQATPGVSQSRE